MMNEYCLKIKKLLRLYHDPEKYKKEMFITNRLSDEDILALHCYSDCLVMPSCGESWSMPVADALGFGKTPIVVNKTGPASMVDEGNGYLIPSREEHVLVLDPPLPDMYTGRELWHTFTVADLCINMRNAFEDKKKTSDTRSDQGKEDIYEYSYDKIAKFMAEIL
jgi:hypothetical protein